MQRRGSVAWLVRSYMFGENVSLQVQVHRVCLKTLQLWILQARCEAIVQPLRLWLQCSQMLPDAPRLSLASLSPGAIMQQLTSRPLTEVVRTSAWKLCSFEGQVMSSVSSLFWEDVIPHQRSHQKKYSYNQLHTHIMNHKERFRMKIASNKYILILIICIPPCCVT